MNLNWTIEDIPPLNGAVAVVTGGNGGLGLETVRELARAGATVVMAARNPEKADAAVQDVLSTTGVSVEVVQLDLASLASVASAAEQIASRHEAVDILVNNAGIMAVPEGRTVDGHERQIGVNFIGHYAFTARLMRSLVAAKRPRVVTVSSMARFGALRVDPSNLNLEGNYSPWRAYNRSKLADYLFAVELHKRVGHVVASIVAHPGLTNSDLQSAAYEESGGWMQKFWEVSARVAGMSTSYGALSQLRAATDPGVGSGSVVGPAGLVAGPPVVRPALRPTGNAGPELMRRAEELTGLSLNPL